MRRNSIDKPKPKKKDQEYKISMSPKHIRNCIKNKKVNDSPLLESVDKRLKRFVASRMFVSEQFKFYYCRIPKAANSTIVRTLASHVPGYNINKEDPKAATAKKMFKGFNQLKKFSKQFVLDNYFCFTFVRHPDARILSAYLDKIQRSVSNPKSKYFKYSHMSFRDFLINLNGNLLYENPHWAPQSELIPFKKEEIHHIGRVENLATDIEYVLNHIFGKSLGTYTRSDNVRQSKTKIDEYFTDYEKSLTREIYHKDFELFYPEEM